MLQGYKTYIFAALIAIITVLHSLGKLDDAIYNTLLALFSNGTVASLGAKINRLNNKVR